MTQRSVPRRPEPRPPRSRAGFSIVEISIGVTLLTFIVGGVTSSFWTVQSAFDEQVAEADLGLKTRAAMDRLVRLTGTALTSDVAFTLVDTQQRSGTTTVVNSSKQVVQTSATVVAAPSLEFREILSVSNGLPVYDDDRKFLLLSPDSSTPVEGVLIGRGPDSSSVLQAASGVDGVLGTKDDQPAEFVDGTPAVEVLLPGAYSPRAGTMLEFTTVAGAGQRLVTITLRVNSQRPDGSWLLESDMVLQERVALRW